MAVYTEVTDSDLTDFLSHYDIGELLACNGIAEGVENSNFLLQTTKGPYILTLFEKRMNEAELPFFLGLMDHLAVREVNCPTPIHGRDGEMLRTLMGKPAVIVSFLRGMSTTRPQPSHTAQLGAALAEMHLASDYFKLERPNSLDLAGWKDLFEKCKDRADEVQPGLQQELADELQFLEANWPTDLPTGVIHADLFPDNVFFLEGQLSGLIDFYFACNDILAYDLAICLNAWCFNHHKEFSITAARHMLASYSKIRPLSEAELNALPILARGAAVRFLLTRLYDWLNPVEDALVKPKDPLEYLKRLNFHQHVTGPGGYGLG